MRCHRESPPANILGDPDVLLDCPVSGQYVDVVVGDTFATWEQQGSC